MRHSKCLIAALILSLALTACGKKPQAWLAYGKEKAAAGEPERALAAFDKALATPGTWTNEAQRERAEALMSLKRWKEACQAAEAATLGLSPVAAKPARILALQACAEGGDKPEGQRLLSLLGGEGALKDPAIAAAAAKLGFNGAAAPLAAPAKKGAPLAAAATPKPAAKKELPTPQPTAVPTAAVHSAVKEAPIAKAVAGNRAAVNVNMLDAVRLGIGKVSQTQSLDTAMFPVRAEFQDPRLLTKVPSPDGRWLVWREKDKKGYYLWLSDAKGHDVKRLTPCKNGFQPVWSPDSKQILFSAMNWQVEERNLFLYDVAKGTARRAFNAKKDVGALTAFSPDGRKIVFTYFGELWVMNASGIGRSLLNLGEKIKKNVGEASLISWSHDGTRLAYRMRGDSTIYLLELTQKI